MQARAPPPRKSSFQSSSARTRSPQIRCPVNQPLCPRPSGTMLTKTWSSTSGNARRCATSYHNLASAPSNARSSTTRTENTLPSAKPRT